MLKRRTSWMLVTVRVGGGPRFWIPVPIWFVGELLRGLEILLWCFPQLSRLPQRIAAKHSIRLPDAASPKELLSLAARILESVRRYGPFTLVQVRDGGTTLSVRLV